MSHLTVYLCYYQKLLSFNLVFTECTYFWNFFSFNLNFVSFYIPKLQILPKNVAKQIFSFPRYYSRIFQEILTSSQDFFVQEQ